MSASSRKNAGLAVVAFVATASVERSRVNELFDLEDPEFLSELEALLDDPDARLAEGPRQGDSDEADLAGLLEAFLAPAAQNEEPLDPRSFVMLSALEMTGRTNLLVETCRRGGHTEAVQAVESFIVFFQALLPTLEEGAGAAVKGVFFRLVPTLLHIAYHDFSPRPEDRLPGRTALKQLETVLLEISSVRLTPGETQLVVRSLDQMTELIGAGDYVLASEILSARLLQIIQKNKLTRALFRLMEVEAAVQVYLKEVVGCPTPEIRIPEDLAALTPYGPVRILEEEDLEGGTHRFIQVHLPHIAMLRDIVLKLVSQGGEVIDLRMDSLGTAPLDLPAGKYALGLVYQPQESR